MIIDLDIQEMRTADLVPYAGNAKEHPQRQVEQIAASIEQFGFNDPVGIWHDADGRPVIVEGHGRVMAAQMLGMESVPVVTLDHLDDEGRRAYGIAHNATNMSSGFDDDALRAELAAISQIDMEAFGVDVSAVLEQVAQVPEDDAPTPENVSQRVTEGDAWRMGEHVLVCGDATDPAAYARLFHDSGRADMLLTDPPYNVDYVGKTADALTIEGDDMSACEYVAFLADALSAAGGALREGGAFYLWYAAWRTREMFEACRGAHLEVRQAIYWIKQQFVLGRQDYQWQTEPCLYGWRDGAAHWFAPTRTERNVIDDTLDPDRMTKEQLRDALRGIIDAVPTDAIHEAKPNRNGEHPTMKPVRLFARLIRNSSRPGETVLDPFAGSGTTVVACEGMGRRARVIELDPRYCDVILERWERMTGKTAERVG